MTTRGKEKEEENKKIKKCCCYFLWCVNNIKYASLLCVFVCYIIFASFGAAVGTFRCSTYTVKLLQQNVIVQSLYVLLAEGKHKNMNVFLCSSKFPYAIDLNNPCGVLWRVWWLY